jgi:hypothetical protein
MGSCRTYKHWPPSRLCPTCGRVIVVRPNGLFRVHPLTGSRCLGSGEVAPSLRFADTACRRELAYLQLLLNLIERHGYQVGLCDRIERVMLAHEARYGEGKQNDLHCPRVEYSCAGNN